MRREVAAASLPLRQDLREKGPETQGARNSGLSTPAPKPGAPMKGCVCP